MNFEQALNEMISGNGVRLSDWSGYWFMVPSKGTAPTEIELKSGPVPIIDICRIKVFTRDGDVLDTPNFDRYKDRNDWEVVTEPGWGFDAALRFMKNGKRVKRASWHKNSYTLSLLDDKFLASGKDNVLEITIEELLANDWQIVLD